MNSRYYSTLDTQHGTINSILLQTITHPGINRMAAPLVVKNKVASQLAHPTRETVAHHRHHNETYLQCYILSKTP